MPNAGPTTAHLREAMQLLKALEPGRTRLKKLPGPDETSGSGEEKERGRNADPKAARHR